MSVPPQGQYQSYPPPPPPQYDNNYYQPPATSQGYYANNVQQAEQQPYQSNHDPIKENKPSGGLSAFKDLWALVLWVLNFLAFIGVSVLAIQSFKSNQNNTSGGVQSGNPYGGMTFDTSAFKIFGIAGAVGFGLSLLYLLLVSVIPTLMIYITFILSIIIYFGVTIYYFTQHYYVAAIIFLIFSCLYLLCFFWWRSRIPFASVMLESVTSIMKRHPSTLVIGFITLIVETAFSIWFLITVVGIYQKYYSTANNNASLNLAMVFLVFSYYWTSQVISYTCYVTLAGIYASVYFNSTNHPTFGSLKRALTYSFGSICFGSLLIALIEFIRYLISVARASNDNPVCGFFLCIADCIVGCFEGFFEWFNNYAFSGVAIYGRSYIESAKRTWTLIKDRGVEAIINDNLINNVLLLGGLLVAVLSSLFGYIYLIVSKPAFNQTGNMTGVVVLVCFITGLAMFSTIATVITSGVCTTFVCLAEDPQALQRTQPALFEKIRSTWPQVVQGI